MIQRRMEWLHALVWSGVIGGMEWLHALVWSGVIGAMLLFVRPAHAGKDIGEACAAGSECNSTYCVEGVCCNTTCMYAPCVSCNVPGRVGGCNLAPAGTPLGGRPCRPISPAPDDACVASLACDGTSSECKLRINTGAVCTAARCDSSTFVPASVCSSEGKCGSVTPQNCAPFGCTPDGCRRACANDGECAGGFACISGNCAAVDNKCSDDGLSSIDKTRQATPCAPFRCGDGGKCWQTCSNSDQCAVGFACDPNTNKCVSSGGATEDEGGCRVGGDPSTLTWVLMSLAGVWHVQRRRARAQ